VPVLPLSRPRPALLAALLLLAGGLAACRQPPEQGIATTLATTQSTLALQSAGPDGVVVGEDHRPSPDPGLQRPLTPEGTAAASGGTVRQTFRLGPLAAGRAHVLERSWRLHGEYAWRRLPPVRVVPAESRIEVAFEVGTDVDPERVEPWVRAFAIPPMPLERTLDEMAVAPGATLIGSYGLDPVSRGIARRPVEFRVEARSGEERHVLLDEVLDPAAPESFRWQDFRLDLGALAGKTVQLVLRSRPRDAGAAGEDLADEVAMPAWSVPRVVAAPPAEQPPVRNVILISLDTLRADYVGAYGQPLPTTPNIDRFATEGVLFENAYTTYPSTTASHMSLFTGLYPSVHGAYGPTHRVPPSIPLLAELLRARGYLTGAVTEDAMLSAAIGFPRGFDSYQEFKSPESRTDGHVKEVVDSGLAWLAENRGGRFFLFLHTYQVHGPYAPPAAYDVFTAQPADLPAEHAAARRGYAGDLLYADAEIGRLLAGLEKLGEAARTVVVITADHGEELGEHNVIGHSWFMTDPVLRVPLVMRAPGAIPPGLRVRASASLVDVTPTLLELIGGPPGPTTPVFQGASLVPLLHEKDVASLRGRAVFSEKLEKGELSIAAHRERSKWKVGGGPGAAVQLFDLESDPLEARPQTDAAGLAEGAGLIERYRAWNTETRAALKRPTVNEAVPVDGDTQHKLRALGYVE